jgi:hypothetical protein
MANLEEIAKSLNVKLIIPKLHSHDEKKVIGSKRRAWLDNEETKGVYEPLNKKGFIDGVDQPLLSTPSINPVDQPLLRKGSIKGVYKPLLLSLQNLRGNPLLIAQCLFELSKFDDKHITKNITQSEIMRILQLSRDSARTGLRFLLKNELIKRVHFQPGKAGWSKYKLKNDLFDELDRAYQKGSISPIKKTIEQKGSNSSSSVNIDLKTTTTNSNPARELPESWQAVEYSLLAHIGFTQTHLLQLSKLDSLELSIVQDSIYHFAFDLKHNNKALSIKGDPLNYFMGIVSKRGAYTAPSNYIDPVLEVMNAYHKTKERSEQQKAEMEQKVQEIEFKNWHDSLTDSEIGELIPEEIHNGFGSTPALKQTLKTQFLKKYYRETLWPQRRRELCTSTANWTTVEPTAT